MEKVNISSATICYTAWIWVGSNMMTAGPCIEITYKYCKVVDNFYTTTMQIFNQTVEKVREIIDTDSYQCVQCHLKPAEIFQINGEYCLECWQEITHTNP